MAVSADRLSHTLLAVLNIIGLSVGLFGCTMETYDSGDGEDSYLKAEFSMLSTDGEGKMKSFRTDDDVELGLSSPLSLGEAKADTVYRALVYYHAAPESDVKVRGLKMVNVCRPFKLKKGEIMKTDPVGWESMWLSRNRSYVNLSLNLLVGVGGDEEADKKHTLGIRKDSTGDRNIYYTLYHDQNNIPEYYTTKSYVSIPVDETLVSGDTVTVTVHTYDGIVTRYLVMP